MTEPDLSSGDYELINEQLSSFIYSFPYFNEVMFADEQGTVLASSDSGNVGKSLFVLLDNTQNEFERALHSALGPVQISDLPDIPDRVRKAAAQGRLTSPDIQMLVAVVDRGGSFMGILVGSNAPFVTSGWTESGGALGSSVISTRPSLSTKKGNSSPGARDPHSHERRDWHGPAPVGDRAYR